jgi:hypothetical protein
LAIPTCDRNETDDLRKSPLQTLRVQPAPSCQRHLHAPRLISDPAVHEETDDPKYADDRMFYKVEKWTRDGTTVDRMLYAGNNLERACELFLDAIKHRPRIRLTIRQRTRVLQQWPQ